MRQIADANGNVTLAKSYEPYGSVLNSSGGAAAMYGFTGEQIDTQTGLLFLRARYLQPMLGIFTSRDPWSGEAMQPESMNGFNYVAGNPINRLDPSGLQAQCSSEGRWNCESINIITSLKQSLLDSASRHNRIPFMDNNGFAALVATIIINEQQISNHSFESVMQDLAIRLGGCVVSGWAFKQAKDEHRWLDAARYLINHQNTKGENLQLATVGIGNVGIDKAANLWIGQACGETIGCTPVHVNPLQITADGQRTDLPNPWRPRVFFCMDPLNTICVYRDPTDVEIAQDISRQLLDNRKNIEYLSANLEAGALRALSVNLQPSAFNSAAWHFWSIQTDEEITRFPSVMGPDWNPGAAIIVLDEIPKALNILGLTSIWNVSVEPQYSRWKDVRKITPP
jgi:RHS repeat-associated protein